jgi:hypothetical protein
LYLQTLLVLLSFFSSPLCCLSFFELLLLFTPLVCLNSSCPFVIFLLAIVLSVLLRFTASVYPFGFFILLLSFSKSKKDRQHNGEEKNDNRTRRV